MGASVEIYSVLLNERVYAMKKILTRENLPTDIVLKQIAICALTMDPAVNFFSCLPKTGLTANPQPF